jgi:glycosyltransferase involved in cell wall biosynthesis
MSRDASPDGADYPRRVLYVLANAFAGGAEVATRLLLKYHDAARYEASVLFLGTGPLVDEVRAMGVTVHVLPGALRMSRPWQVAAAILECRRVILAENAVLVHASGAYAHLIAAPAARSCGVPVCIFQHGPVGGTFEQLASFFHPARVLANSHFTRGKHEAIWGTRTPIDVIPLATEKIPDAAALAAMKREAASSIGLPAMTEGQRFILGMVTRFDPQKGIDLALEAAGPMLRERPDARFLIVGGTYRSFHPQYGEALTRLVAKLGISKQVVFTGFRDDPRGLILLMDVLVSASRSPEGFGLSVLEAMALGKAVVSPRSGGTAELIEDGVDGLLFESGVVSDLEEKLVHLAADDQLRKRLGAAARRKAAGHTPDEMAKRVMSAYDNILTQDKQEGR